jgi:hypothetical protein
MRKRERPLAPLRQMDLLARVDEQPAPRLPPGAITQTRELLRRLLVEIIEARRAGQGGADE